MKTDLPPITVDYRDIAEAAGLTALNVSGGRDMKKYILETTGNGVAIFDYDNDGLADVYLANATAFEGEQGNGTKTTGHLYRNVGNLRFENVTERAGLARTGWGQGVCVGDYDNDGRRDLFLTYYGQSLLYRNEGDGTFRDVTDAAGLRAPDIRWDTGCSFFDYDLDGKLDLIVANYLEFDRAKVPEPGSRDYCEWKGLPVPCGPRGLPFSRNYLFHNDGRGRFTDVSVASGIARTAAGCYGFTATASDFDGDAYPDVYVACDLSPSLLYHNQQNGTFEETGLMAGVALDENGQMQGGMGVAAADYDDDGDYDIAKTNFSDDVPNLYQNDGELFFQDRVFESGVGAHMDYVGWGVHFVDVDHDGRRDLLIVNGHVYPQAEQRSGAHYKQPRLLFWNVGGGKFIDLSERAGSGISAAWSSRGSAVGDLDNDGDLEVVVSNMGARPSLLQNFGPKQRWLLIRCVGTTANRDAVGARVRLVLGGRTSVAEVQSGSGYISQNDHRLHFGVRDATRYERIEVRWPGGTSELFPGGETNRIVTVTQGQGSPLPASKPVRANLLR